MAAASKVTKKKPTARTGKTARKKVTRRTATRSTSTVAPKPVATSNGKKPGKPVVNPNGMPALAKRAQPLPNQKETLEQERALVESELVKFRAELQDAPDMTGDEVDLNVYEREKTLGLVSAYERRLEEIDTTLKLAAQGKYGICERCGNPIAPERLQIFPETRLCINCKNIVEREQRRLRL